jgi:hypothetical protein
MRKWTVCASWSTWGKTDVHVRAACCAKNFTRTPDKLNLKRFWLQANSNFCAFFATVRSALGTSSKEKSVMDMSLKKKRNC